MWGSWTETEVRENVNWCGWTRLNFLGSPGVRPGTMPAGRPMYAEASRSVERPYVRVCVRACVSVRSSLALVRGLVNKQNPQGDQRSHITSRPEAWRCRALLRTLPRRQCGCLLDKR